MQCIGGCLSLVLTIVFVWWQAGGVHTALMVYVAVMVMQGAMMWFLARNFSDGSSEADAPDGLSVGLIGFGLRIYAGALSTLFWVRASIFVLGHFHGAAAVGIFSVAQQLAEKMLLPAQIVKDVIYRRVAEADAVEAARITNRYVKFTIVALLPVVLSMGALAPSVCLWLFGPEFAPAARPFQILLAGTLVMLVTIVLGPFFLAQLDRPGLMSILACSNGVMNVLLAIALVPRWGVSGAAASVLITQMIGTFVLLMFYIRLAPTGGTSSGQVAMPGVAVVK